MKMIFTLTMLIVFMTDPARAQYPADVQAALGQTKNNRQQLSKALDYFYRSGDPLKIRSINFLVANMPMHHSDNYYWADAAGRRVPYNELAYPTFNQAVRAFDRIRTAHGKLHPVPYEYRDIDSIKADMLIENVELAVKTLRAGRRGLPYNEEEFLEYQLPYRVSVEPLQNWRKLYAARFDTLFNARQSSLTQLLTLKQTINNLITNEWGREDRSEPLPRLSALQILSRQKGFCEDIADMATFIARSKGVAATVDDIPEWATASGNHFLNFIRLDSIHAPHFDAELGDLGREPAKVLRTTYSAQPDAIATWLDTAYIPRGKMRLKNYKDVTQEYWATDDITSPLFGSPGKKPKAAFVAVYNGGGWRPVWYGRIEGTGATFRHMSKGAVYLPMYYLDHKLVAAGWPWALGYRNKEMLQPDTLHTHVVSLPQQEKYLIYRPGKTYRLFYWNNQWRLLGEQRAAEGSTTMIFDKAPKNALLILIPEYSEGKERPFMIGEDGNRVWW